MRTRAIILAGGEGSRLGILTAKRTKPAVPFAGKYRIIDFPLSNCVNSGIFDVMILAQYRPHSLIEHIGSGSPWDLDRGFSGGARIYTPYKARHNSDWYMGTADALQQNFSFIKSGRPDIVLILSGDHVYKMNYAAMIEYHQDHQAHVTLATIKVPLHEANRFGIVGVDEDYCVKSFVEKPARPPSDLANMGVYVFNLDVLDRALWEDHRNPSSSHDFGKDILPRLVQSGYRVCAYPYYDYWVDVGTVESYWQAHMDLLVEKPPIDLNDRNWVVHTKTEEQPPVRLLSGAYVADSMITDGCVIYPGARVERSILAPGVRVLAGATIRESIVLTDTVIGEGTTVERAIIDKRVDIGSLSRIGGMDTRTPTITMIGKNSVVKSSLVIEPGAVIGADVTGDDFPSDFIRGDDYIQPIKSLGF